ncbi:hypothetical protein CMI39_01935 [Candidatus Pacearchaeota archaeon]|jgi:HD-GYP domain-containing protein (c-di-GMP phosphodiesterase class II)|nr:hypothetical protein [Candidatus Pacearchaeota archaeon]|tara:strand:+ start:38 stop:670 length:633 start_codon:yes stop_codon:yes gene_type:complete
MSTNLTEKSKKLFNSILKKEKIKKYLKELKKHHRESYEHILRAGLLCIKLGYKNKFSKEDIKLLGYSGLFHDAGKIKIPKEILSKKSLLSKEEKKIIDNHSRFSFSRLNDSEDNKIKKIIIMHHEYQTNPYPRKLSDRRKNKRKKERRIKIHSEIYKINKLAEILAVADMYDALKNKRAYKKQLTKKEIEKILNVQFSGDRRYIKQVLER